LRNLILKIVVSILLIATVIIAFVLVNNNKVKNDEIYNVNIVVSSTEETIRNDNYQVKSDVTLFNLLDTNYDIVYDETIYGVRLLGIDTIITDFKSSYIAIYVDNKYSNYGISNIKLYDGIKISFKEQTLWT